MLDTIGTVVLLGGGNMGCAMAAGWLTHGLPRHHLWVVEPQPGERLTGLGLAPDQIVATVPAGVRADVLVLAVKPQVIDSVLAGAAGAATAETLVLSIAAGTRMRRIAAGLNDHGRIVRAMPNTPASIGRGITGLCAGSAATAADRDTASALLAALGSVVWVEDERLLDPITAVSGSGPAFLFAFVEALEAAAQGVGLDAAQARQFARATVTGAAALLDATGSEAAELRRRVTSPNGTTQAGLDVLLSDRGLVPLLKRTVTAATRRAKELGESA